MPADQLFANVTNSRPVDVLRDELARAVAGRVGWSRDDYNSYSVSRAMVGWHAGSEFSGTVVGNPNGWWWSAWYRGNPLRSMADTEAEPSAVAAVNAVEEFVARAVSPGGHREHRWLT